MSSLLKRTTASFRVADSHRRRRSGLRQVLVECCVILVGSSLFFFILGGTVGLRDGPRSSTSAAEETSPIDRSSPEDRMIGGDGWGSSPSSVPRSLIEMMAVPQFATSYPSCSEAVEAPLQCLPQPSWAMSVNE